MIDGVLDSHKGFGVKELKMHMTGMRGARFEKLLEFAYTNQIEIIDVSLLRPPQFDFYCRYSLGLSKFINGSGTRQIKFLKQLTLDGIGLTDQDFEALFASSNFVALESASLGGMRSLMNVSIVGHPKLKHVAIQFTSAAAIRSFEIRDVMNLVSLSVDCDVDLKNIPKLTEVYYCDYLISSGYRSLGHNEFFAGMSSCIRDQVKLLHISTTHRKDHSYLEIKLPFKFVNVKHIELEMEDMSELTEFHSLKALIRACPSLQKLKMKLYWNLYGGMDSIESGERKANVYYPHLKNMCPNLQELEMEGYAGSQSEFELAS